MDIDNEIQNFLFVAIACLSVLFFLRMALSMAMIRSFFSKKADGFHAQYYRGMAILGICFIATAIGAVFLTKLPEVISLRLLELASHESLESLGNLLPIFYSVLFLNYFVWIAPLGVYWAMRFAYPYLCQLDPGRSTKHIAIVLLSIVSVVLMVYYFKGLQAYVTHTCDVAEHFPEAPFSPALRDVFQC